MNTKAGFFSLALIVIAESGPFSAFAGYHLERVSPVLNQPTFLTQIPGDPSNIVYYTTRIGTSNSGFGATNTMGRVWRFDLNTRSSFAVLSFSGRRVYNDDGLQTVAFHPDFKNSTNIGYGKMYTSSAEYLGPLVPPNGNVVPVNRVEEFFLDPTNPAALAVFQRTILQFTNNAQNNHTVDWIGFDPTATGAERNYLYISTGDTSYGNAYNAGISPFGRPSQNPTDVRGKILRVDISGGDDYPADPLKNFVIPASNPVPVYNATHAPITALGELWVTGMRNGYRLSFDRATGDLYWGDVGENAYEEVSFLKAGSNASGPPLDYGWPQLEGIHNGVADAPHTTTNPFTGVTSLYPIREYSHAVGSAAIGGYVYHGPIPELQGKYFYADFVSAKVWMLDFDRNADPSTFRGTNGILTDMTSLWNSRIIDTTNASYRGDTSLSTLAGLDHIVSFGEDNEGNLYLVDFGFGTGFTGQYTATAGEIFKLVADPTLGWTNTESGLQLSWGGGGFKLQVQTNELSAGLGTNWSSYPGGGTSPVTVPIDANAETMFFRLSAKP